MTDLPDRSFRRAFCSPALEAMASRGAFERGWEYAEDGRVDLTAVTESSTQAVVRGTSQYEVRLWLEEDEPMSECSCPAGQRGTFCKHAVAVGLVATKAIADPDPEATVDVRGYLEGLDRGALVELLIGRAMADQLFGARLRLAAAGASAGPPPTAAFRASIDEAFYVDGFVGYRDMYDYAAGIDSVIDSLTDLLDDGHAEEVIALAEYALNRAEEAAEYVDDSDGRMSDIAERLQELHLRACLAVRPDPATLAQNLFERERTAGQLDVFHAAAATYVEALGPVGLAEYRKLAQAEWDAVPPLGPEDKDRSWSSRRVRITKIMESLAQLAGDVDEQVSVLARDQSSAYQFVRIAHVLREAQRHEDALTWAGKGLELHGTSDDRLVTIAAEEYHRAGRGEDAVRLVWTAFSERPALRTYQGLAEHAERIAALPMWRDRALELLRSRAASTSAPKKADNRVSLWRPPPPDGSTLVEVLLFDSDIEQAWAEATRVGCRNDLWMALARRREHDHPLEAIPIWQAEVERCINAKNNNSYAEAVEHIAHIGTLMESAGRAEAFEPYRAGVRAAQKPKRNLMKLFAARGW